MGELDVVRIAVELISLADSVDGRLEAPPDQALISDGEFVVSGWAVGLEKPVKAVELVREDSVFKRIELEDERPDVVAAFPERISTGPSGFRTLVRPADIGGSDVLVRLVLDDDEYALLATLRVRQALVLDPDALAPTVHGEYDLPSEDALRRLRSSPAMRWAAPIDDDPPPGTAWQRITGDKFFEPLIRREFTIGREDRVFAIGSCFARGVEGALADLEVDVASRTTTFDRWPTRAVGSAHEFTNKYNSEAIRNELSWALEPGAAFPREGLVRLSGGKCQDPYAASILTFADQKTTMERHRLLTELTRQIADCRIVVITLGSIEAFFDTKTGLHTNTTPDLTIEPDRFRFRVFSFDRVVAHLNDVYRMLATHGHSEMQIVVTVSPVPLEATFTGQDVVLANTLSKSILRAAAGAWTQQHENVHYFPIYEIAMNSNKTAVWHKSGRHVRARFVNKLTDLFVRTYLPSETVEHVEQVDIPTEPPVQRPGARRQRSPRWFRAR